MIIRSKDKVQVGGKNKPVWVLDTDALIVTHNTADAEPSVTTFTSDHKWKAADREYLEAMAVGNFSKAQGLENMLRLCAREPIYAAMVYV